MDSSCFSQRADSNTLSGFTLVEVLTALVIMAVCSGSVMSMFTMSRRNLIIETMQLKALFLAQKVMEESRFGRNYDLDDNHSPLDGDDRYRFKPPYSEFTCALKDIPVSEGLVEMEIKICCSHRNRIYRTTLRALKSLWLEERTYYAPE